YMKLLDIPIGLLINFHEPVLKNGISRMILPGANQTVGSDDAEVFAIESEFGKIFVRFVVFCKKVLLSGHGKVGRVARFMRWVGRSQRLQQLKSRRRLLDCWALDFRCRVNPGAWGVAPPARLNVDFVVNSAL